MAETVWGPQSAFGRDLANIRAVLAERRDDARNSSERCRRWRLANPGRDHAGRLVRAAKRKDEQKETEK